MADPKQVSPGSGIDGIASLLQLIGGKTTTTQNSADTSQLQSILGNVQGVDLSKMLESIFAKAAGTMPGLQARFSNAVGARSGNNGAVEAALSNLLQDTVLQGQSQIAQQTLGNQQLQGDLAAKIASLTSKQSSNTGTNMTKAAQGLGLLQGVGTLMNSDFGKKAKDVVSGLFSPDNAGSQLLSTDAGGFSLGDFNFGDGLSPGGDFFDSWGTSDLASGASDFLSFGEDASGFGSDVSDVVSDAGDWISGLFGFAEGGLVGRDGTPVKKFADGGVVSRAGGGRRSSAPSYTPNAVQRTTAVSRPGSLNPGYGRPSVKPEVEAGAEATPETGFTLGQGALTDAVNANLGMSMGKSALGFLAAIPGITASPLTGILAMAKAGFTSDKANDALNLAADPLGAWALSQGYLSAPAASAMGSDALGAAANAISSVTGQNPMDALMSLTDAFGTQSDAVDGLSAGMDGNATGGLGAASESGVTGGEGSGIGGDGYKNGGKIPGRDKSNSDTVPAQLTRGEYVVSQDVVAKLGVDFFDQLQAAFHKPAGV